MPTYISVRGKFVPAKETVGLVYNGTKSIPKSLLPEGVSISGETLEPGMPFLYDGPDRAALEEFNAKSVDHLGRDFMIDPEFLQAVRNLNFNSVDEYLKFVGYDKDKEQKEINQKISTVKSHEIPKRVEALKILAGGAGSSKSEHMYGGFGEVPHK